MSTGRATHVADRAEPPRRTGESGSTAERARHEEGMDEQNERQAAQAVESVEGELREPLLVDPLPAVRPDHQRVVRREPVLGDDASGEQRHPAVGRERRAEVGDQDDGKRGDHHDEGAVLFQACRDACRDRASPVDGWRSGDRLVARAHRSHASIRRGCRLPRAGMPAAAAATTARVARNTAISQVGGLKAA